MKKFLLIPFILLTLLVYSQKGGGESDFEISKNIDIFMSVYKQIHLNYVDELNSGELMKTAIDAMLLTLDPYTNFIPESEIEDYKFMTTGQYGGIGSFIHRRGQWVYISEPYQGFPADKAGLRPGDKILEINGKSAQGKTIDEVSTALKGTPGTDVTLLIQRDSADKPFEKVITREEVKVDNVPYYGMVSNDVGYINLSEFKSNAAKDVKAAFQDLNKNSILKGVIIDLRGNGGGLLNEAVSIVNIFVDKGQLVVSTKGKLEGKDNYHRTTGTPTDTKIPIVVLVDEGSASASEIVTGALQDLDRAVIIGQRTYGKGLVQNIVPLSYNAQLKVTISKYYIPSGRCVQELDYSHKNAGGEATKMADSVRQAFKTRNGRIVYEGSGIDPDIILTPREMSNISQALSDNYLFFDFAVKYRREHSEIPAATEFMVSNELYDDFTNYLLGKSYSYTTESEKTLAKLKTEAEKEKYFEAIKPEYDALISKMMHDKNADLIKFRDEIKLVLKLTIAPMYYYQKGRIEASLSDDQEVIKAIQVLHDPALYKSILDGSYNQAGNTGTQ